MLGSSSTTKMLACVVFKASLLIFGSDLFLLGSVIPGSPALLLPAQNALSDGTLKGPLRTALQNSSAPQDGVLNGNRNENVLPDPNSLSTQIFPLCARTSRLAIASPKPIPPTEAPCCGSFTKSSKISWWYSGAMPGPVSETATRTALGSDAGCFRRS